MRLSILTIVDKQKVTKLVNKLVYDSQFFEFTPLPDDVYEVKVKDENNQKYTNYLSSLE